MGRNSTGGIVLQKNVVVAPQPRAVEAGIEIFRRGGNAIDAAVATAFAQGVMDPLMTSLGGFGVMLVRPAGALEPVAISFHGRVPLAATPDMFTVLGPEGTTPMATGTWPVKDDANQLGYRAATVPGVVRGLGNALARFGRLTLADVVEPAARMAENGAWRVTPRQYASWTGVPIEGRRQPLERFCCTPAGRAIYTNDGKLWPVGTSVPNVDLAETLRTIGREGADTFYSGSIAERIASDFVANGGLISGADLSGYRTDDTAPLCIRYRGYEIWSSPPPAGGLMVLEALGILSGYDLQRLGHNTPAYLHLLGEVFRWCFGDLSQHLGDQHFVDVPTERLLSPAYAAEARNWFDPTRRTPLPAVSPTPEGKDTTHVTAVDADGNVVSITQSIGAASGVVTPGLGFLYNGQMHRFNPIPGHANSIAPGKTRVTGMSPTIVMKDGKPVLALGAPGGQGIIHGVLQAILNVVEFGMTATEAVVAPRLHCEMHAVTLESRFATSVAADLVSKGHQVQHSLNPFDRTTGRVQAVTIGADGRVNGGSDPRDEGVPMYG